MKLNYSPILLLLVMVSVAFTSCSSDDDGQRFTLAEPETYPLYDVNNSEVMGSVTFFNNDSTAVVVSIQLTEGTGQTHPANIYFENANQNGSVAVTLNQIDANGVSVTNFSALDDGTDITYDSMLTFDGSVKVALSSTDNTIVALSDIGNNAFTGNSNTRPLEEVNNSGVSGIVIIAERKSGEALVAVQLDGTVPGEMHPATLVNGDVATPGTVAATLAPVDGTYGESRTPLTVVNTTEAVSYADLITFNGHVNIRYSSTNNTLVAQGNIGAN